MAHDCVPRRYHRTGPLSIVAASGTVRSKEVPVAAKKFRHPRFCVKKATFLLIESGRKDLLIRSVTWIFSPARVGDVVEIRSEFNGKTRRCLRRILAARAYATMFDMVEAEDLVRLAHGDKAQTMGFLGRIFRPE
jgi:hypothetical protein